MMHNNSFIVNHQYTEVFDTNYQHAAIFIKHIILSFIFPYFIMIMHFDML